MAVSRIDGANAGPRRDVMRRWIAVRGDRLFEDSQESVDFARSLANVATAGTP